MFSHYKTIYHQKSFKISSIHTQFRQDCLYIYLSVKLVNFFKLIYDSKRPQCTNARSRTLPQKSSDINLNVWLPFVPFYAQ